MAGSSTAAPSKIFAPAANRWRMRSCASSAPATRWSGWTGAAVAAGTLASLADASQLHSYLPLTFLGICGYWQIIPVLSASMGAGLDMRKLLVYPAPHGRLFLVEVLLRLT